MKSKFRDMPFAKALSFCLNMTRRVWISMDAEDAIDLWRVIGSYIRNNYNDQITDAWARCKDIIDGEVGK